MKPKSRLLAVVLAWESVDKETKDMQCVPRGDHSNDTIRNENPGTAGCYIIDHQIFLGVATGESACELNPEKVPSVVLLHSSGTCP